jgi:lysozyme family protein
MSIAIFNACLHFTLNEEGGYVDNPNDLGGATNFGITQITYNIWRKHQGLLARSVQWISPVEVQTIYREYYWQPSYGYLFTYPLALAIFDSFVQFNPKTVLTFEAEALNEKLPIGQTDLLAKLQKSDPEKTALAICNSRIAFRHQRVIEDPSQVVFLKGWLARDDRLKHEILNPTYKGNQHI